MDLWRYGVAFKGSCKLTNTTKMLRQLTGPGNSCEKDGTHKNKDKNLWARCFESFPLSRNKQKGKVDKVGNAYGSFIQPLQRESVFFKPLRELACQGGEKGRQAELGSTLCGGLLIQVESSFN